MKGKKNQAKKPEPEEQTAQEETPELEGGILQEPDTFEEDQKTLKIDSVLGVTQALADILKPFRSHDPEAILKKASLVGNTKDGGKEVYEIVRAAHRAYKVAVSEGGK